MTVGANLSRDGRTLTVRIPMKLGNRGKAKAIIVPAGASPWAPTRPRIDNTLIKALVRAHCWKRMLEAGKFSSITELAQAEGINTSYVSRVLQLTLLAPHIVEAILDGKQPAELKTADLLNRVSVNWAEQRARISLADPLFRRA